MAPPERMPRELATVAESAAAGPIRLLEYLPDLAADLDTGQAATASRKLTVPAIELGPGCCGTTTDETVPPVAGRPFGLLVAEGLLAREDARRSDLDEPLRSR